MGVCLLGVVLGIGTAQLLNFFEKPIAPTTALSMLKECNLALHKGKTQEAKRLILLAERHDIESPLVHKHFGNLFSQMQMKEKAIAHYSQYLKLQPNAADTSDIKSIISQLENQINEVRP